jgi:deoxyguanosine kinase
MGKDRPGYIVVEGPIGVGKTSLAKRLAESFETDLMLEGADENPFLASFYQDPRSGALPAQLFFLFQRVRQIEAMRQADMFQPVRVADFLMEKDHLFAELTLGTEELKLYEQVYAHVSVDAPVPVPDLVVYLQAPADVLLKRISRRGIKYERKIDAEYLRKLSEAYSRMFLNYDVAPLLIVNTAGINLVDNDAEYEALLEQIHLTRSGKHYFNPMSAVI